MVDEMVDEMKDMSHFKKNKNLIEWNEKSLGDNIGFAFPIFHHIKMIIIWWSKIIKIT